MLFTFLQALDGPIKGEEDSVKTFVVTTTIYVPDFLRDYVAAEKKYNSKNVHYVVVADTKTPAKAKEICAGIPNMFYLGIEEQQKYLQNFPELEQALPWCSIARRNVGHLLAFEKGADSIIMLDDDNLSTGCDFVKEHGSVGKVCTLPTFESSSGWLNVCESLVEESGVRFYPRGYPPSKRWNDGPISWSKATGKTAVNAGLWINDPDIDAITRLERRLITTDIKKEWPRSFALENTTWSPWNCQNTALSRDVLPAYFLSPYTGRHLDIWASYITNLAIEAIGDRVTFGVPLAFHARSPHNLYRDLEQELPWIEATDEFCGVLKSITVNSATYKAALESIIEGLKEKWKHPVKEKYIKGLEAWVKTFNRLGVK